MTRNQQPIKDHPHAPGPAKSDGYGPVDVEKKPKAEKGKYDKPSDPADDFVIDEQREKPIRGNESSED